MKDIQVFGKIPDIRVLNCTEPRHLDVLLDSGIFSLLSPEKQIELYNNSVGAKDLLSENLHHGNHGKIVDYDPLLHAESVDYLIRRTTSSLICGSDLPCLDDLNCHAQVYLIDGDIAGVIAHEKHISNRYISLLAVSETFEGNGVMREMIEHVAIMRDPLVALVLNSNIDTLAAFNRCGFQTGHCHNGYYEMHR